MDPPFIKLSSNQRHGSKGSDTYTSDDASLQSSMSGSQSTTPSTPSESPPPELGTHNTARARYHMKDIGEFAQALETSANRALPNRGLSRYKDVQVLLLRWEEDELEVEWELNDLAKVFGDYGFSIDTWLIPTRSPLRKMMGKALEFIEDHESRDTLLIVYYGGHAKINEARQSTWSCTRNMSYSSFEWNACQSLFEQSTSDTLLLFDCCSAAAAASSVPSRTDAITETIAACGWETWAPEPGRHSFTNALIEVLEDWIDRKSFSAAMLHSEVLSVLKATRPKKKLEISKTPIYIVTTSNPKTCSIEICRRNRQGMGRPGLYSESPSTFSILTTDEASSAGHSSTNDTSNTDGKLDLSSLIATLPDNTFSQPHVLMSVALETDQTLDLSAFEQWMKQFPALARYAKIQGIYQSYSTLLILSIPVILWNLLPENPACNFVGYTKSDNMLKSGNTGQFQPREVGVHDGIDPLKFERVETTPEPMLFTGIKNPAMPDFRWPTLDPSMLTPRTSREASPLAINYNQTSVPEPRPSLQAAISQSLGRTPKNWALIVRQEGGEEEHFMSSSLTTYSHRIFTLKFTKRFQRYSQQVDSVVQQQMEYNSGYYSEESSTSIRPRSRVSHQDWDSDESSEYVAAQKRRTQPHWNSDSEESEEESLSSLPVTIKKPSTMPISEEEELEKYYRAKFQEIHVQLCKVIAKAFIKAVEPRKQLRYPYSKGQISAPPWWPPLSGADSVRHREPDHLFKQERIELLIHILRMSIEPVMNQHPSFRDQDLNVQKLRDVTFETLANFVDRENPETVLRTRLLRELFTVARYQERYKNGEIGGDTKISVAYLGSLEEESGEDDETAVSEISSAPSSQPASSSPFAEGGSFRRQEPRRYRPPFRWENS